VAASIHSGEHAPRARGRIAHSAMPHLRWRSGLLIDSLIHGAAPPCRASAPPRSSTAKAVSAGLVLLSRSYPLLAFGSVPSAFAGAPAAPGSRPRPGSFARRHGWRGGAPHAGARPRSHRSARPPTRTARRRPAPGRSHDIARIDRPRAAPAGAAGQAPRSAAPSRAVRASLRSPRRLGWLDPGLHLLHPRDLPHRRAHRGASRWPAAAGAPLPQALHSRPQVFSLPPGPPSNHLHRSELLTRRGPPLRRRHDVRQREILCDRPRRRWRAR
jgi:hypothetical protein